MVDHHNGKPAVNIKMYKGMDSLTYPLNFGSYKEKAEEEFKPVLSDPGFDFKWIAENLTNGVISEYAFITAEDCIGRLVEDGVSLFQEAGYCVEIWQNGRSEGWLEVSGLSEIEGWLEVSGLPEIEGWLEVSGLPEIEDWDADLEETFKKFEEMCEAEVEAYPESVATTIYMSEWEPAQQAEKDKEEESKAAWAEVQRFLNEETASAIPPEKCIVEKWCEDYRAKYPRIVKMVEG